MNWPGKDWGCHLLRSRSGKWAEGSLLGIVWLNKLIQDDFIGLTHEYCVGGHSGVHCDCNLHCSLLWEELECCVEGYMLLCGSGYQKGSSFWMQMVTVLDCRVPGPSSMDVLAVWSWAPVLQGRLVRGKVWAISWRALAGPTVGVPASAWKVALLAPAAGPGLAV